MAKREMAKNIVTVPLPTFIGKRDFQPGTVISLRENWKNEEEKKP